MTRPRKSDDAIVAALAHGKTHAEAARLADVSERTIRRRLQDPDFGARVNRARAEVTTATAAQLTSLTEKAIEALRDILDFGADQVRVRAAQIVLKSGLEYHERSDLEDRLVALEEGRSTTPSGPPVWTFPGRATTGQNRP